MPGCGDEVLEVTLHLLNFFSFIKELMLVVYLRLFFFVCSKKKRETRLTKLVIL